MVPVLIYLKSSLLVLKELSRAPFGHIDKKERWALVHFIRSLTKNKISDDSTQVQEFAKNAK